MKKLTDILQYAIDRQCAIGAFNGYSYETFKGIVDAGEEIKSPIILAFGAKYLSNISLQTVSAIVRSLDAVASIPICLHLDHCNDIDIVFQAVSNGFTSVMYDGSQLPFDENIANTIKVCKVAHANNVSVEAELGCISTGMFSHEGEMGATSKYTDPKAAKYFVETTNVDALAVSIGTVHGMYKGTPNLQINILKQIHDLVPIPLVLHGGSGLSQKEIRTCIANGIKKINVNTEVSMFVINKTKELLKDHDVHYSVLLSEQRKYVKDIVKKFIIYFNGGIYNG